MRVALFLGHAMVEGRPARCPLLVRPSVRWWRGGWSAGSRKTSGVNEWRCSGRQGAWRVPRRHRRAVGPALSNALLPSLGPNGSVEQSRLLCCQALWREREGEGKATEVVASVGACCGEMFTTLQRGGGGGTALREQVVKVRPASIQREEEREGTFSLKRLGEL